MIVATEPQRSANKRLPAYGKQLKAALDAGLRPSTGGGSIIVSSEWGYATAFNPGRVVCPPEDSPDDYDFAFLNGCEVIVLVHERDELHGRALLNHLEEAGAKLVVLSIVCETELC